MNMNDIDPETEILRQKLVAWLSNQRRGSGTIEISGLKRSASGFSNETQFLTVRERSAAGGEAREERLVLRLPPRRWQVFPEYDLGRQVKVMRCLATTDLPVPRVIGFESDPGVLGGPFYLMGRLEGVSPQEVPPYHSFGMCSSASEEQRARMWWGCLEILDRVHRLDWKRLGLGFLGTARDGAEALDHHLTYYRDYLDWVDPDHRQEILRKALGWLADRRPRPKRLTLCWGDCRLPNLLYQDFKVTGVLDWEMAHLGDPESDLAWLLFMDWFHSEGHGIPRLKGFPGRDETVERYQQLSGQRVENLAFHEVLAALKFGVIFARIVDNMRKTNMQWPAPDYDTNNPATQRLAALLDLPSPSAPRQLTHVDQLTGRAQFHLTGPGGHDWYLEIKDGQGRRVEGCAADPVVTLTAAADDWTAIQEGRLDRMQAFMQGKMKIEGDMSLLMQLEEQISKFARGPVA
jgi:aminoglycoside phosphotransferase (APT) family kinase protein